MKWHTIAQLVGMILIVAGVGLWLGVAALLITAGVAAVVVGVAFEIGEADAGPTDSAE